jgi:hypothetical protein
VAPKPGAIGAFFHTPLFCNLSYLFFDQLEAMAKISAKMAIVGTIYRGEFGAKRSKENETH